MKVLRFTTTTKGSKCYETKEHIWDIEGQLNIEDLLKNPIFSKFSLCGKVVKSDNAAGFKIELVEKFVNQPFIIYLLVKDGKVLKGGKSKNPLNTRSYSAGTEESWTERGTPSDTNYVWSQIFRESLKDGKEITFYGYIVPYVEHTYTSFDGTKVTEKTCGHYETEEKKLNHLLNRLNGKKVIGEGNLLSEKKS